MFMKNDISFGFKRNTPTDLPSSLALNGTMQLEFMARKQLTDDRISKEYMSE